MACRRLTSHIRYALQQGSSGCCPGQKLSIRQRAQVIADGMAISDRQMVDAVVERVRYYQGVAPHDYRILQAFVQWATDSGAATESDRDLARTIRAELLDAFTSPSLLYGEKVL